MANDVNKTFAGIAGFVLIGGFIAAVNGGGVMIISALFACYMMLVATNSISRGEKRKK